VSTSELPAVSVVIATRDRKELLAQCLAAVEAQEYDGVIECLVVHDQAEPDPGLERRDGPRPIRVLSNTRTPGLAGARNTGILAATHPWVAFCDDDDAWLPRKTALQVAELQRTGADVAVTGITVCYADHEVDRVPAAADMRASELARRRVMEAHPSSVVVSRDALMGPIGLVDEEIPGSYGEDYDWILRAAEVGTIAVVEQPLVRVLWGAQSYYSQRWETIIAAIDYGVAKHPALRNSREGLARLYGRKAFALAALGRGSESRHWARESMRLSWKERRAYLAVLVSLKVVSADRLQRLAHSRGRGI
jgi:glycosyltransferase involved in cell wall biosynthesis